MISKVALHARFLLGIFFDPEGGGSGLLGDYVALRPQTIVLFTVAAVTTSDTK
jgi:hypothetical protein